VGWGAATHVSNDTLALQILQQALVVAGGGDALLLEAAELLCQSLFLQLCLLQAL